MKPSRAHAFGTLVLTSLKSRILTDQGEALKNEKLKHDTLHGLEQRLETRSDGVQYFNNRVWIPKVDKLREMILKEAHNYRYSIHVGDKKIYSNLRKYYWWLGMKKYISL